MKFTINKNTLETIINNFQPFLSKDKNNDIKSYILILAREDEIELRATDLEIGIKAKIKLENIEEQGETAIHGKMIMDSLKNLRDEKIIIEADEDHLEIKQNKTKIEIQTVVTDNFPQFPNNYEKSKINIDSISLINSLKKIFPVIDINNPRQECKNALINIKEYQFDFIATDTKRLELISFNNQSIDKLKIMIQKRAINELQKLFNESAEIYYHENYLIVENKQYTFFTNIPNGNFIDYEKVIPKEIKYKINIEKNKMIEAIKIINSISNQVKITFTKNKILLESMNGRDSKANTEIELNMALNKNLNLEEDVTIGINSRHIIDYINHIDTNSFEFGINENINSACIFKSDNFTLVCMPILM